MKVSTVKDGDTGWAYYSYSDVYKQIANKSFKYKYITFSINDHELFIWLDFHVFWITLPKHYLTIELELLLKLDRDDYLFDICNEKLNISQHSKYAFCSK